MPVGRGWLQAQLNARGTRKKRCSCGMPIRGRDCDGCPAEYDERGRLLEDA